MKYPVRVAYGDLYHCSVHLPWNIARQYEANLGVYKHCVLIVEISQNAACVFRIEHNGDMNRNQLSSVAHLTWNGAISSHADHLSDESPMDAIELDALFARKLGLQNGQKVFDCLFYSIWWKYLLNL